jgi:hypothetical protein
LILNEYLAQSHTVNRVVYLDPYGTGRRYLREHRTLFRLSVGADAAMPGEVSIIGGRVSDRAAAEFAALRIGADPVSAHGVDNVLLVGRPAETDKHVTALASAEGVDSIIARGLPECAAPTPTPLPIPFTAVDSITDWIDGNAPARTHRVVPQYLTTVTMPAERPDGVDVLESIERIEPSGLFAIRTQPRRRRPAPAKTVLFFVMSNDLHVGPAREWVELSRRIAAAGSQAVRWDPAGQGLSGPISRDRWRRIYSKADIADSVAVARQACHDAGELQLVGICSGAWYAAQAARNIGAQSAILINVQVWNWRVVPTLLSQRGFRKITLNTNAPGDTGGAGGYRPKPLKALLNPAREPTKSFMHNHLPRYVLRVLSWAGLVYLPEVVLTTLARRGTDVTLIAAPEDAEQFTAKGGGAALDRLQCSSRPPRLIATSTGDHPAHHPAVLAEIRNAVLPVVAVSPSDHVPVSNITSNESRRIR